MNAHEGRGQDPVSYVAEACASGSPQGICSLCALTNRPVLIVPGPKNGLHCFSALQAYSYFQAFLV